MTWSNNCAIKSTREIVILVGFILATLVLNYPLSLNPSTMVPDLRIRC